jgi:dCTP deaminase
MFLSDATIRKLIADGTILVEPFYPDHVQPCSLDLRLGDMSLESLAVFGDQWILGSKQFALGSTEERVRLPSHIAATVSGKSTHGRRGLAVHITAGHVDPGFDGQITLEMYNHSAHELVLTKGVSICQLIFTYLDQPAEHPYTGRYQGQKGPTPARLSKFSELHR